MAKLFNYNNFFGDDQMNTVKRIAVTGAAGQIAYQLLFRIASGELFGPKQPISLHLLEVEACLENVRGVVMELEDCSYPLLKNIQIGSNPFTIFSEIDIAILIGSAPRMAGMERRDLIHKNAKIFVEQGTALNAVAKREVKVFVIGNPCNTNCLVTMSHAPNLPRTQFYAMTRLDLNRAKYLLAKKAQVNVSQINQMIIWGNHSSTQVPDFEHVKISGEPILDRIKEITWLQKDFITHIQQRGAAVLRARGKSSAASAAKAILDFVQDLCVNSNDMDWFSAGVCSDKNAYGIEEDIIFSFPCTVNKSGDWKVVNNLSWSPFIEKKIEITRKELLEERDLIRNLLKITY